MRYALVAILVVASMVVACSKPSDESAAKRWQEPPPPPDIVVPEGVSIAVEVDGSAAPPITSAALNATKPDFADVEHRAWLVKSLVPAASGPGTTIEASSRNGISVKLTQPTDDGLEPAVYLTRRSEVIVAAIDPKQPFPPYHGQGGRLHRGGDAMPHVADVAKLAITHPVTH
jgi:hypothetical protein